MFLEWIALPGAAVLLLMGMLLLQEVGRRSAPRKTESNLPETEEGTGTIVAAVFALMGLLLAFQFSEAAARLDHRRNVVIREANAIGTGYLRLDLLPLDAQEPLRERFRSYVEERMNIYQAVPDMNRVWEHQAAAIRIQNDIWKLAVKACDQKTSSGVNVLLFPALNEIFDVATMRDTLALTHGSPVIAFFLISVCLLASLLAGRSMARSRARPAFHMVMFAILISVTVYLILDLEFPRVGLLRVGAADQAMLNLRESMR